MRTAILWLAAAATVLLAAGCGSSKSSSSTTTSSNSQGSGKTIALISDIGKFNDRSFNQSQKEGLDKAHAELGVQTLPLQSNSTSDYIPNLTSAVRKKADLIISAGFLLADATNTVAKAYPNLHFAITDYSVKDSPFNGRKNVEGLTYAANESGCRVQASVYAVNVEGAIRPQAEIDRVVWVDPSALPDLPFAPLTRDHVLPLARAGG